MKVWRDEMVDHVMSSVVQAAVNEVKKWVKCYYTKVNPTDSILIVELQFNLSRFQSQQT